MTFRASNVERIINEQVQLVDIRYKLKRIKLLSSGNEYEIN